MPASSVRLINRQPTASIDLETSYSVNVICRDAAEAHVRALLLQGISTDGLHLRRLDSANIEGSDRVEVIAALTAEGRANGKLEHIVGRLSLEPQVTAARWRIETGCD
jgi:putative Mg2+ transporter-C (MgtC) family protein